MVSSTALVSLLSLATASMAAVLPRNETLSASGSGSGAIPGPGTTHEGDITHYTPNGGIGACGNALQNGEAICALSAPLYDKYTPNGNPNNNPLCGKQIKLTKGGETVTVTVADRCEACTGWDVDLTPDYFSSLVEGGLGVGRTQATWEFLD